MKKKYTINYGKRRVTSNTTFEKLAKFSYLA